MRSSSGKCVDELLCNLFDLHPGALVEMLREQAADLRNPRATTPRSMGMYAHATMSSSQSGYSLAELLGALSLATDSANGVAPETALRTAIVATFIGRAAGLSGEPLHDVFMTALLRFLGCTAYAHETAKRYAVVLHLRFEGADRALEIVRARQGTELDPALTAVFLEHAGEILPSVDADSVWETFLAAEPAPRHLVSSERLIPIAEVFADYADLKSPFTLGHSRGVSAMADRVAAAMNLSEGEGESLRLAALLHDLGRVAVPNGIWDKRGALSRIERERVRSHAHHTALVLERSPLFEGIVPLADHAHERLDGSGYPRAAVPGGLPARILAAADVFHALQEERPHRRALARDAAAKELGNEPLDPRVVSALLDLAGCDASAARALPDDLSPREAEVLELLACGLANKEIAARLAISPKTVQHHVARVYEKTGIRSRAAAAMYAVRKGLLDP